MYWIGLTIALIGGLLEIKSIQNFLRKFWPSIDEAHFDKALIICLIIGLSLTTIRYCSEQTEITSLSNQVVLLEYQEEGQLIFSL